MDKLVSENSVKRDNKIYPVNIFIDIVCVNSYSISTKKFPSCKKIRNETTKHHISDSRTTCSQKTDKSIQFFEKTSMKIEISFKFLFLFNEKNIILYEFAPILSMFLYVGRFHPKTEKSKGYNMYNTHSYTFDQKLGSTKVKITHFISQILSL